MPGPRKIFRQAACDVDARAEGLCRATQPVPMCIVWLVPQRVVLFGTINPEQPNLLCFVPVHDPDPVTVDHTNHLP